MSQAFTCPQGHRWQAAAQPTKAPQRCPVCGAAPAVVAPVPASVAGRAEPASPVPPPRDLPGTVLLSGSAPREGKSQQDRTLAPELPVGAVAIGRTADNAYDILGELGRGGMGVVYKAREVRLNRLVALKMILSGSHAGPQELARFKAEAEALAPLQHANIVQIYAVGELDGHPYFSLEFIEGGSLSQKLAGNPQPARQAGQVIEVLARAMHFAHSRGIVHRDLKPANILLSPRVKAPPGKTDTPTIDPGDWSLDVEMWIPKVTDFGLAKRLEGDSSQTKTGAVLGTPSYIAPEQAAGRKDIGPGVDIYALGAILYELLTGRPPFRGESSMDTMLQVMTEEVVPPKRLQPKVPVDLEVICLKCLEKEPHRRYPTAEHLAEDLRRFLAGEPIQARPAGVVERSWKWARRRPALAALVAVCVLAVLGALAFSVQHNIVLGQLNRTIQQRAVDLEAEKKKVEEERQRAVAAQKVAEERLVHSTRSLYAFQLMQVASLSQRDPRRALDLLQDPERCPADLRDFTWFHLHALCRRERGTLTGSKTGVSAVAINREGTILASADQADGVTLWDLTQKQPRRPFKPTHRKPIVALASSPDGQLLATGSLDNTVKLWNVTSGEELATLEGHTAGVHRVAFSPDGKTLASCGHDATAILWDVDSRTKRATLARHKGPVTAVAFAADGKLLATGGSDRTIRLWDPATGQEAGPPLQGHEREVLTVAFAPVGKLLASGSADQTVKLWQPGEKQPLDTLRGHLKAVNVVLFSPDGKTLASGSADSMVKLWYPTTGEERTTLKGHTDAVSSLAFTRDGKVLASGSGDKTIKLWDIQPGGEHSVPAVDLGPEPRQKPPVTSLSSDGRSLVTVNPRDKVIQLRDLTSDKERLLLQGYTVGVESVALSPDNKTLAAGCEDQAIRLYDLTEGRLLATLTGHKDRILCLAFAADNQTLASGSADQSVRLWSLATKKELAALPARKGTIRCLAFTRDGKTLATGDDQSVKLWDVAARTLAGDLGKPSAGALLLAFSSDGQTLATSSSTNWAVQLWDVPRRQPLTVLKGHAGAVRCLAFSPEPESKTLATGHADWTVTLWDARTGQERATLSGHTRPLYAVSFTSDKQTLISLDDGGAVHLWQAAR